MSDDSYWLVTVDRASGAVTSKLYATSDEAWQASLDVEQADPGLFSTVVGQRARRGRAAGGRA